MSIDINKHEVEIDTLFKQNELDLCSIKELYRKLKDIEKKITQIKYIDSNLADKLKKDYEKLKRIILDENIQAKLTNDINEINSQLDNIENKKETKSIKDFKKLETDKGDSLRIQRLFNWCIEHNKIAELEPNVVYNCDKDIELNIGKLSVIGNNATLDFTNMNIRANTVPYALLISSNNENIDTQNNNYVIHLKIKGTHSDTLLTNTKQCCGVFCDVTGNKAISHVTLDGITIDGFKWGIMYGNNAYIIRHYGLEVFNCETGIYMGKDLFVNYGENINFVSSTVYHCGTGVYNENNIGAFNFVNCSIDYNYNQIRAENKSMIFITNSHIEGGALAFECNDDSIINVSNSWIVWTESLANKYFKGNSNQGIAFENCNFYGGYLQNNIHQNVVNGTLRIIFNNAKFTNDRALSKQLLNAENSKIPFKYFNGQVGFKTTNITDKWNCDEISIKRDSTLQETGFHCYKIEKKMAGDGGFQLILPKTSNYCTIRMRVRSQTTKQVNIHICSAFEEDKNEILKEYTNKIQQHIETVELNDIYKDLIVDICSINNNNVWVLDFDLNSIPKGEFISIDTISLFEY